MSSVLGCVCLYVCVCVCWDVCVCVVSVAVCVCVNMCVRTHSVSEAGLPSGHTDLIVRSFLLDMCPFQRIPLPVRLGDTVPPPLSLPRSLSRSVSPALSTSLPRSPLLDGIDLVTVVFCPLGSSLGSKEPGRGGGRGGGREPQLLS